MFSSIRIFLLGLLLASCASTYYRPAQYKFVKYQVGDKAFFDSSLYKQITPYRDSLSRQMSEVIGVTNVVLTKEPVENTLGFFVCDALRVQAAKKFNTTIDLSMFNYGGLRINAIQPGNITVNTAYELLPFDNQMVVIDINGQVLKQFFEHIAGRGLWPISGGTYTVKDKKLVEVLIGNEPIDNSKNYTLLLSDYIANGGDDCKMLVPLPKRLLGYFQRDGLIDYLRTLHANGVVIEQPALGRIKAN